LPAGIEIRIDGNALLTAVRYELEKITLLGVRSGLHGAAAGGGWQGKYTAQARAVLALRGIPWACRFIGWRGFKRW
jgi:hypothetical protein